MFKKLALSAIVAISSLGSYAAHSTEINSKYTSVVAVYDKKSYDNFLCKYENLLDQIQVLWHNYLLIDVVLTTDKEFQVPVYNDLMLKHTGFKKGLNRDEFIAELIKQEPYFKVLKNYTIIQNSDVKFSDLDFYISSDRAPSYLLDNFKRSSYAIRFKDIPKANLDLMNERFLNFVPEVMRLTGSHIERIDLTLVK